MFQKQEIIYNMVLPSLLAISVLEYGIHLDEYLKKKNWLQQTT